MFSGSCKAPRERCAQDPCFPSLFPTGDPDCDQMTSKYSCHRKACSCKCETRGLVTPCCTPPPMEPKDIGGVYLYPSLWHPQWRAHPHHTNSILVYTSDEHSSLLQRKESLHPHPWESPPVLSFSSGSVEDVVSPDVPRASASSSLRCQDSDDVKETPRRRQVPT